MAIVQPSLSTEGWLFSITRRTSKAMAYFFISEYSQSDYYKGNITSFKKLVQLYGDDVLALRSECENALNKYLNRLFDNTAEVSVTVDDSTPDVELKINATVRQDSVRYSVGYLLRTSKNEVLDIFDLNNNGYLIQRGNTNIGL